MVSLRHHPILNPDGFLRQTEWSGTNGVSFARSKCREIRHQEDGLGVFHWGNKLHRSQLALAYLLMGLSGRLSRKFLGAIGASN